MRNLATAGAIFFVLVVTFPAAADDIYAKELRGIWLRPPADVSQIPKTLDDITSAGFNAVFVETFYHGFTIFPSEYVPLRPEYKGQDLLALYVKEAHKRGLQVHCWVEVFYWEVDVKDYPKFPKTTLFDGHPDWLLRLRDGSTTEKAEKAHIFANPAHPEVQRLLINYFTEIVRKYDVDGIDLDYIRYNAGGQDAGYDDFTRAKFKAEWGVDPKEIDKEKSSALWQKWVSWRENQVTEFLLKLRAAMKNSPRKVLLAADVFSEYYKGSDSSIFQDWRTWIDLHAIDAIIPMAYATKLDGIRSQVEPIKTYIDAKDVLLFAGLAAAKQTADAYGNPGHPPLPEQIALIRQLGIPGEVIFCYDWMKESGTEFKTLPKTVYAEPATADFAK